MRTHSVSADHQEEKDLFGKQSQQLQEVQSLHFSHDLLSQGFYSLFGPDRQKHEV